MGIRGLKFSFLIIGVILIASFLSWLFLKPPKIVPKKEIVRFAEFPRGKMRFAKPNKVYLVRIREPGEYLREISQLPPDP